MTEKYLLKNKLIFIKHNDEVISNNQEIITIYNNYLYKVIELFDYLIRNKEDLFYTIVFDILLDTGFFSLDSKINKTKEGKHEITTHLGINVLAGNCCCRNIASFYQDVLNHFFFYPLTITCLDDSNLFNPNQLMIGNHIINITKYHNNYYFFDLSNNILYYPVNRNTLIRMENKYLLYWKKYGDIIMKLHKEGILKDNYLEEIIIKQKMLKKPKNIITNEEYHKLIIEANEFINNKMKILQNFYANTYHYKEKINHILIKK